MERRVKERSPGSKVQRGWGRTDRGQTPCATVITFTKERRDTVPLLASSSGGFIALSAVIYFVLLVTLGIISIRKGHWVMFIIGIFVPLFWFIGALLPRRVR
jgi:hypothetical protein